jgi:hypothetical protein
MKMAFRLPAELPPAAHAMTCYSDQPSPASVCKTQTSLVYRWKFGNYRIRST